MPSNGTHFRGPILNKSRLTDNDFRSWDSNRPLSNEESNYVTYYNDFLVSQDYNASDFVVTETQAGATQGIDADVVGGSLGLVNSAADDDVNQLQSAEEFLKLSSGKQMWLDCRVKLSDVTQSDMFIGLATTDTSIIAGTTDSCGFRKLDGSASLTSLTEDATVETINSIATLVDNTFVRLHFYYNGSNAVFFYVDGNLKATHTTNIEQTNKLALTITLQNGEAAAKELHLDYLYIVMER